MYRWLSVLMWAALLAAAMPCAADQEREQTPQGDEPEEDAAPAARRRTGRVLLPGSEAYDPRNAPRSTPGKESAPPPARQRGFREANTRPAAETAAGQGDLFWSGRLEKKKVIRVTAEEGVLEGGGFPGLPVTIRTHSPAVEVVEQPGPEDGWRSFSFRCLRSTKQSVTINFRWSAAMRPDSRDQPPQEPQ